jgi:hypothetical protein
MHARVIPWSLPLWLLAVSIWLVWSPFELRDGPLRVALWPTLDAHLPGHFLLLVPLGVVLAVAAAEGRWSRPVLQPWLLASALALVLELGQWGIERRSLGPHDVLLGSLGAAAAILGARALLDRGVRATRLLVVTGLATFLVVAALVSVGAVLPDRSFRLSGWDPAFVVVEGAEVGATRAYAGEVRDGRICGGRPPQEVCIGPDATEEERRALIDRAHRSQVLTVSALVRPGLGTQTGPARIITFSAGTDTRNVTLAQEGADLIFRVRTPRTGPNGTSPQFVLPLAVPDSGLWQVEATFSEGTIGMVARRNGAQARGSYPGQAADPPLRTELERPPRAAPFLWGRGAVAGAGILFAGIGLGAAWALRRHRHGRWIAGPALALVALLAHDVAVPGAGIPAAPEILFAVGAALAGTALAVADQVRTNFTGPSTGR